VEVNTSRSYHNINNNSKGTSHTFLHWRYKTIALGNAIFGLLKDFLLEVGLPN
jgi:hypothetical protein